MTPTLHYVVYAAGLTLLSLFMGSFFRNRLWTVGLLGDAMIVAAMLRAA